MFRPADVPMVPPVLKEMRSPAASVALATVAEGVCVTGALFAARVMTAESIDVPPPGAPAEASFVMSMVGDELNVTTEADAFFRRIARVAM